MYFMTAVLFPAGNKALRNYNGGIPLSPYVYRGQKSDVEPPVAD